MGEPVGGALHRTRDEVGDVKAAKVGTLRDQAPPGDSVGTVGLMLECGHLVDSEEEVLQFIITDPSDQLAGDLERLQMLPCCEDGSCRPTVRGSGTRLRWRPTGAR